MSARMHEGQAGRSEGWQRLLRTSIVWLAVALPFAVRVIPVFIVLIAVAVVALRMRQGRGKWNRPSLMNAMPWMALFYLLHLLGMAWTSNTSFGSFDLEVKAAFLLFPLLFWLLPKDHLMGRTSAWRAFAWANAGAVIVCLVVAIWHFGDECYLRNQGLLPDDPAWTNHFFESRFSLFLHPSYMAMYLCFALATVLFRKTGSQPMRFMEWAVPALLGLGIILCNSKMGWLTLGVVVGLAVLDAWQDVAMRRRLLVLSAAGVVLFAGLFVAFPTVSGKLTQAISATGAIDPASDQSSALRRMAWDSAAGLFRARPFTGVGTGDIKDELTAAYHTKGYVHAEAKRMNAHSQFLQSAAALGAQALLVVLAMLVLSGIAAWRSQDRTALAFWLIVALNWSVESMAEVQAGVLFTAFFGWLLVVASEQSD